MAGGWSAVKRMRFERWLWMRARRLHVFGFGKPGAAIERIKFDRLSVHENRFLAQDETGRGYDVGKLRASLAPLALC
jgi:hypothetical protein